MEYAIGIDIGGTKTAIGIVNVEGILQEYRILPTDLDIPPEQMIDRISDTITSIMDKSGLSKKIIGIGIGSPGPLSKERGMISCPPNLPNWIDVPIVEQLAKRFSLPIWLENDASLATLAEKWVGAAKDNQNFVYVTISTGIGAGIFINGELYKGSKGNAGEIGHMVVDPSKGTCTCGQAGCLEWIASGTAISRRGSEIAGRRLTTQEVFELYHKGDEQMSMVVSEAFRNIGVGCVTLINLFDPEKIVIGGGVSSVGEPLFQAVHEYVHRYALNPSSRGIPVVPSGVGEGVGMIGAAALVFHEKARTTISL